MKAWSLSEKEPVGIDEGLVVLASRLRGQVLISLRRERLSVIRNPLEQRGLAELERLGRTAKWRSDPRRLTVKVADIAQRLGVEQKRVYKRLDRLLSVMRRALESAGVTPRDIANFTYEEPRQDGQSRLIQDMFDRWNAS